MSMKFNAINFLRIELVLFSSFFYSRSPPSSHNQTTTHWSIASSVKTMLYRSATRNGRRFRPYKSSPPRVSWETATSPAYGNPPGI